MEEPEEEEEVFVFVPPTKEVVEEKKVKEFKIEEDPTVVIIRNLHAKITQADSLGVVVV